MQHLPKPSDPKYTLWEVPCHTTTVHDGKVPIERYAESQGWGPRSARRWHSIFNNPPSEFSAFLQRWLFFGPLAAVLRKRVELEQFTRRTESNDLIITTEKLPELLAYCPSTRMADAITHTRIAMRDIMHYSMCHYHLLGNKPGYSASWEPKTSSTKSIQLLDFIANNNFKDPRSFRLRLSIAIVLDALEMAIADRLRRTTCPRDRVKTDFLDIRQVPSGLRLFHRDPTKEPIFELFVHNGWCPSDINQLFTRLEVSTIVYLYQFKAPPGPRRHLEEVCTIHKCGVSERNKAKYETAHAPNCANPRGCTEMVADYQRILEILESGEIPLIKPISDEDKSDTVSLIASRPKTKYTAISHVWSDGLGNKKRSAIPRCQLLRLSRLVNNIDPSLGMPFWLDTICCPPTASSQHRARSLAIHNMARTYSGAWAVLVLDSWLLSTRCLSSSGLCPREQIMTMTMTCRWNDRLWTFQEGTLVRGHFGDIYFQFADIVYQFHYERHFPINYLTLNRIGPYEDTRAVRINQFMDRALNGLRAPLQFENHISLFPGGKLSETARLHLRLWHIMKTLQFRSTTHPTDEALCLSVVLGLDMTSLDRVPPKKRIEKVWMQIQSVPREFLTRDWPRLTRDEISWAPDSILRNPRNHSHHPTFGESSQVQITEQGLQSIIETKQYYGLQVTDHGLQFMSDGLVFPTPECSVGGRFHIVDENNDCYRIEARIDYVEGSQIYEYIINESGQTKTLHKIYIDSSKTAELVYLNMSSYRELDASCMAYPETGILAEIVERKVDIIYARRLCSATRMRCTTKPGLDFSIPIWNLTTETLDFTLGYWQNQTEDMQWCVKG